MGGGEDERGRDRNGVKEASVKRVDVGRISCTAWQLDCVTHVCSLCWGGHPTHAQTDFQENIQMQVHAYTELLSNKFTVRHSTTHYFLTKCLRLTKVVTTGVFKKKK